MTFKNLPLINLLGKKGRSGALFIFALFLSFSIFGGAIILSSLKRGLKSLEYRLGADIIVTSQTAYVKKGLEDILLFGNRTYFYMPKSRMADIAQVDGVELVSPQIFLATLSSGCCSIGLQIIGFDPETDFTVKPWLSKDFLGNLQDGDVIIGSKIGVPVGGALKFYGVPCRVAGQLGDTGTGLDNAVYTTVSTIKKLIAASVELGHNDKMVGNPDRYISSVMVKVKDGYDLNDVARAIDRQVKQVKAVKTKSMTSGISDSLANISRITGVLTGAVWFLCLLIMIIVFTMIISERKKEFAVLRVMGASQKKLSLLVLCEAVIVNTAGSLSGILLAGMAIFPFHSIIEDALNLPFLLPSFGGVLLIGAFSLFLSVLAGSLTSAFAAHKISKIDAGVMLRDGN